MTNLQIRYLSKIDIEKLNISIMDSIEIVQGTYLTQALGKVYLPAKVGIYPEDNQNKNFFHAMPSMIASSGNSEGCAGIKWVSYFPGNKSEKGLTDASCVMILNDTNTGLPYCIMEGMYLTNLRTAASGAIAAKRFANPNAKTLGVVGAGSIARWTIKAINSIMPGINEVNVISRTERSKNEFCEEMSNAYEEIKFNPSSNLEDLVRESDIVLTITSNTSEPFINFDWLKAGALALSLDGIKSWDASFKNADNIITDDRDYFFSEIDGYLKIVDDRIYEISDIVGGNTNFQWKENERNIVFMNGIGSTDVAIADYIYKCASKENVGSFLSF